ncbi:18437_t:CDS:2 [Funneliformis geosporum]|nr:18437_t:CDS:2 [Funneliformis geosporum]
MKNHKKHQYAPNCHHSIEETKRIAYYRNGDCLSEKYINSNSLLLWCCAIGHEWYSSFSSIKNSGTWYPQYQFNRRLTLEDAKQIAINRGGECLSEKFDNSKSVLLWRYAKGHEWHRENLCCEIISKYLGLPSKNRKPDFLKILEHLRGLELDIPYYHYGFAIKVQEEQHEKYIKFFHRDDPNNFIKTFKKSRKKLLSFIIERLGSSSSVAFAKA